MPHPPSPLFGMARLRCAFGAVIIAVLVACPSTAFARIERLVGISYQTQAGWSDEVVRRIEFVTGF